MSTRHNMKKIFNLLLFVVGILFILMGSVIFVLDNQNNNDNSSENNELSSNHTEIIEESDSFITDSAESNEIDKNDIEDLDETSIYISDFDNSHIRENVDILNDEEVKKQINKIIVIDNDWQNFYRYDNQATELEQWYQHDFILAQDLNLKEELILYNITQKEDMIDNYQFGCKGEAITLEKYQEKYYQLFGKNSVYEAPTKYLVDYYSEKAVLIPRCGGYTVSSSAPFIYNYFEFAEKNETEIYLYERVAVILGNKIYNDFTRTNQIAENITAEDLKQNYNDSLSRYKYTFKYDNDDYYFYSIEKVD